MPDIQLAHIKFSTQIIKRLGEELNPSIDQSILELVKNSYDADAKHCTVDLKEVTREGGTIEIQDDGDGMDGTGIIEGWLVLGQSSKSIYKKSRLGRIPAGSKGLGRLAAIRMGNAVGLESIPANSPTSKYNLIINWNDFDSASIVEDVQLAINHIETTTKQVPGTKIVINELKQKINERDVKKIARGLILLSDPFDDDPDSFKPVLKSADFKEMEELVSKRYFSDADYHLSAIINADGTAEASVLDYKGQELFRASHKELAGKRKGKTYECPPTTFDLWSFILNSTMFTSRYNSISEVREWLGEFGGVHLYENGLRVNPYGNPGNDWLNMNLSRARSPEERPSTNNSIGVVRVRDSKGLLYQKTDRSGFIENDVFHEIRIFCQDAMDWMARKRVEIAEHKRSKDRVQKPTVSSESREKVIERINKLEPIDQQQLELLFTSYDEARQEEVKVLRSEVQLYRTLSTAGITAATFSHESRGNPLKVITQSIKAIERRTKENLKDLYDELFSKPVNSIYKSVKSLEVLGSATLRLLSHEKRRVIRVEIHSIIRQVTETFAPFFEGRDITILYELADGNPYLRSSEAAVESILTNLLNNSIVALENYQGSKRQIKIRTTIQESTLILTVLDNGPGINGISLTDIWLPGETTNPNGTGLGLTIVRDAAHDLGGEVSAIAKGELGGAEMNVELPIIGI